jgi:acyl-homoserine-lactone acylase
LWDSYGVPHIYAKDEAGAFRGFGWAQAKSHGNVILRLYGQARGRAAEYWGASYADDDRWMLANGIPDRAELWYRQQPAQFRRDLDAFASGINAFAAAHPGELDPEVRRVLPITGVDIVAHAHRLMNYVYIANPRKAYGDSPAGGSNAWAVAPSRSASGKAMLLSNPHLPWASGPYTYYEAQLTAPGFSIYGATQVGLPVIRFAFNKDLGFTNTVNTILGSTTYRLTLKDGGYVLDGQVRPFTVRTGSFRIRQPDGALRTESLTLRSSVHGPVFDRPDGTTVALRVAGLDRPGMLRQYFDMGRAHDLSGFLAAVKRMQVPMFNIVYADRKGHILYLDNGILPRHAEGDYVFWNGVVPGDRSDLIWKGVHGYADLPKVIDPPTGFVQNANDPPWLATFPYVIRAKDYPPYIAAADPVTFRAEMSARMMAGQGKLGFDDFIARKLNTTSLMAERLLPLLVPAALASPDAEVRAAGGILAAWDRRFEADSRGALLFETWAGLFAPRTFLDQSGFAVAWNPDDPLETPSGIRDMGKALALLKQAAADAKARYGAIDRSFGDVSRFRIDNVDLPGNGGFGNLGVFRTITWGPLKDGTRTPVHGETWVSMVEFGTPMKAVGMMSYGNASQPGSKHRSDQLSLLAEKRFRTLWLDRAEVEANLEERTPY